MGIDRVAFELASRLRVQDPASVVMDSGLVQYRALDWMIRTTLMPMWKLGDIKAQLYHGISPFSSLSLFLMGKRPIITTIHDLRPFQMPRDYRFQPRFILGRACLRLARHSDYLVVPFEGLKSAAVSKLGASTDRIHVIPYGVDLERFAPKTRRVDDGTLKVLYLGGIVRAKGLQDLLRAFAQITAHVPRTRLFIGGQGRDLPYMQQLSVDLGIGELVDFLGFVREKQLVQSYEMADIFVWPSRMGWSLQLLESMACGTPVVTTSIGHSQEIVADAGILYEPGAIAELGAALVRLLNDYDLRQDLAAKGVARAQMYSWNRVFQMHMELYATLSASKQGGS